MCGDGESRWTDCVSDLGSTCRMCAAEKLQEAEELAVHAALKSLMTLMWCLVCVKDGVDLLRYRFEQSDASFKQQFHLP